MSRWIIESNIGYGWEQVHYAGSFKEEEEAWDFIYSAGEGGWDGQVRAVEEDDDEFDDLDDIGTADEEDY